MNAMADRPATRHTGLVIKFPRRPHELLEPVTPLDGVFTLAHFGIPEIDTTDSIDRWTIEVDGMVRRPLRLTLDELMRRPKRTVVSVHECAGNPHLSDPGAILARKEAWAEAYRRTPHGKPVALTQSS
jgi:DMSO/TMAO reductase YedYZ molybdopterin-dependent catalytic subunit